MKHLELFSGYGTASFALKRLGLNSECVGYSDIDKYANQCFMQNHMNIREDGQTTWPKPLGDVKKIVPEELEDFDLLTGGFPCQAFSVAGKGLGELDPRGTLFWEIIRIAEVKKPRYMLLENVKGLTNKNHQPTFQKILNELYRIGYRVHWKVLNTKDYGIPQSRSRVFFACFLEENDWLMFKWPDPEELKIFVKDILEENVDEKYYLNDNFVRRLMESSDVKKKFSAINPEVAITETARQYSNYKGNFIVAMRQRDRHGKNEERGQTLEPRADGCSNTITSVQKDNLLSIQWETGEKDNHSQQNRAYSVEGSSPTLGTNSPPKILVINTQPRMGKGQGGKGIISKDDGTSYCVDTANSQAVSLGMRIRRLTPKECFRLQGFLNDEINLEGISDSQRYKLAGNGQTVTVVEKILRNMLCK